MTTIEILIGMIGSGKSTYARKRADEGALIISHDDLTQMLHGRYRYEQGLRDTYRLMEEDIAHIAITNGKDVVVDRCHLTAESRDRWVCFASRFLPRVLAVAVVFPIEDPEVHARRRFEADPRGRSYLEWLRVARHHNDQAAAEPIGPNEGFDVIRLWSPMEAVS